MIRGVQKPEQTKGMGLSRRVLIRVGALLKKRIEITETVLEMAKPDSAVEGFLLSAELLSSAENLSSETLGSLVENYKKQNNAAASSIESLNISETDDGIRVVCLAEELDAEDAWGAYATEEDQSSSDTSDMSKSAENSSENKNENALVLPGNDWAKGLASSPSGPSGSANSSANNLVSSQRANGEALFSRTEIDRLRLKVFTAADASERIESIRIIAYAPIEMKEKAESVLGALEDKNPKVRGEAAGLLNILGLPNDWTEELQQLSIGKTQQQERAAEKLIKRLSVDEKTHDQQALALAATAVTALAALKAEEPGKYVTLLVQLLSRCVPGLIHTPQRMSELVRVCLRKLAAASTSGSSYRKTISVGPAIQRLFKNLIQQAGDSIVTQLHEELNHATAPAVEAFLLQTLLESKQISVEAEKELLKKCTEFLAKDTSEGRESRLVGMAMLHHGKNGVGPITAAFPSATIEAQKYLLRLMDDLCRQTEISVEELNNAARTVLQALDSTSRSVRMAAMNARFTCSLEVEEELRTQLAEGYLTSLNDFGFRTDIEIVEDTIAQMGLPALQPLRRRLDVARPTAERIQALRILGTLGLEMKAPHGQMKRTSQAVTNLLRQLRTLYLEKKFPDKKTLLTSLGKLAASPGSSKQASDSVMKLLLTEVKTGTPDSLVNALEGLTWVASSRRATPNLVATVWGLIRNIVLETEGDISAEETFVDGAPVLELKSNERTLDILPVAIAGLTRIARSRSCPPAMAKEMLELLIERWKNILSGDLIWGPANAMDVILNMVEIAKEKTIPDNMVLNVLKALVPRLHHPPAMNAIGDLLKIRDVAYLSRGALSIGEAIVKLRNSDGKYEPEDRPDILKNLCKIAARKHVGAPTDEDQARALRFRETATEELFHGVQDLVPGCLDYLRTLRDAGVLPEQQQSRLEKRISEMTSIVLV